MLRQIIVIVLVVIGFSIVEKFIYLVIVIHWDKIRTFGFLRKHNRLVALFRYYDGTMLYEFCVICVRNVIGISAHGNALAKSDVSARQHKTENRCGFGSIISHYLIKISDSHCDDTVTKPFLRFHIFLIHGICFPPRL